MKSPWSMPVICFLLFLVIGWLCASGAPPPLPDSPHAAQRLPATDVLDPEFLPAPRAMGPEARGVTNRVTRAAVVHAGQPAATNDAEEASAFTTDPEEIDWPLTALAVGGVVVGSALGVWGYNEIDDALSDDAPPAPALTKRLILSGAFTVGNPIRRDCGDFFPTLLFTGAFQDLKGGRIESFAPSQTCGPAGSVMGEHAYSQVKDGVISITGPDSFYVGDAAVDANNHILTLANGVRLVGGRVDAIPFQAE